MKAIISRLARFLLVPISLFRSKPGLFSLGIVVGILSFAGVLSIGEGSQAGSHATTLSPAVLPGGNAATSDASSYVGAVVKVWMNNSDSNFDNYQLERDACCPGSGAK